MQSKAIIVGKPKNFDFKQSLKSAQSIKIAMAFATSSGWSFIKDDVSTGSAVVEIVVGLNGCITTPKLLQEWFELGLKRLRSFHVSVSPTKPVFHPKVVLITEESGFRFAIIGSGNLTQGGQLENVECGVYVNSEQSIKELDLWFAGLERFKLTEEIIDSYRKDYDETKRLRAKQESSKTGFQAKLRQARPATRWESVSWESSAFLNDFKRFMKTNDAIAELQNRVEGAKNIRRALRMPTFDFNKSDWNEFYTIRQFGTIRLAYPNIAEEIGKLRNTFRTLIAEPLELEILESALAIDGEDHVRGVGTNLVSKVLTVHDRRRWPLFNDRVMTTFGLYGYKAHWGAKGYLQFAKDIRDCLANTGEIDFWSLDVFSEYKSR